MYRRRLVMPPPSSPSALALQPRTSASPPFGETQNEIVRPFVAFLADAGCEQ
jgi:hypothetical protein